MKWFAIVAAAAIVAGGCVTSSPTGDSSRAISDVEPSSTVVASSLTSEELSELHVANFLEANGFYEVRRSGWTDVEPAQVIALVTSQTSTAGVEGSGRNFSLQFFDDVTITYDVLKRHDLQKATLTDYEGTFSNTLDADDGPVDGIFYGMSVWTDVGLLQERVSGYWIDKPGDVRYAFNTILRSDGSEGIYVVETPALLRDAGFD